MTSQIPPLEHPTLPAHRLRREQEPPRAAIIGGGPLGLEAALYAHRLGHRVWLFEREDRIAADVLAWAHVTMFTPWAANASSLGRLAIQEAWQAAKRPPRSLPAPGLYPTGGEFIVEYLEPLSHLLGDSVLTQTRVVGVGRSYLFPEEHADSPEKRSARRFRLLTRSPLEERIFTADYVLDASGVSHTPNWLGAGGLPALGEMGSNRHILYGVPDVAGRDRIHFLGKKTLLVGDAASAATTALALAEVAGLHPSGSFLWVAKSRDELPYAYVKNDPIARRDLLYKKANLLIKQGHPCMEYLPVTQVEAVQHSLATGRFQITLQVNHETRRSSVDTVVAAVGSRRDSVTFERVLHPQEPGFYTVGEKAASPHFDVFLLEQGRQQIREAFRNITGDAQLDLYAQADSL